MKKAMNHRRPLSEKVPSLGLDGRVASLLPFISCTRKYIDGVTGIAVDVDSFEDLSQQHREVFDDDPIYTAFARAVLYVLHKAHPDDKISVVCDDEEKTAWPMYTIYRRIKLVNPEASGINGTAQRKHRHRSRRSRA